MSWKKVRLEDISKISKGKKHDEVPLCEGATRYIQIEDLHGGDNQRYTNQSGVTVSIDDIIIAWDGANAGKVGTGLVGTLGSTIARIRFTNSNIHTKYIYWHLNSKFEQIKRQRIGATIPHVNGVALKNIEIPIPPLSVQRQVADIIDHANALHQKDQELLQKYKELSQSIFFEMFGDPIKNDKGWHVTQLGELVTNRDSLRVPIKDVDRKLRQGEFPYYGATGQIDCIDNYIFNGKFLLVSEDGKNLLLGKRKNAFRVSGKFWVNNHAHVLEYNGKLELTYLEYFLNNIELKPYITGIDQFKLNRNNMDRIPVCVPAVKIQKKFTDIIDNIERQKLELSHGIKQSETLFKNLLSIYM